MTALFVLYFKGATQITIKYTHAPLQSMCSLTNYVAFSLIHTRAANLGCKAAWGWQSMKMNQKLEYSHCIKATEEPNFNRWPNSYCASPMSPASASRGAPLWKWVIRKDPEAEIHISFTWSCFPPMICGREKKKTIRVTCMAFHVLGTCVGVWIIHSGRQIQNLPLQSDTYKFKKQW